MKKIYDFTRFYPPVLTEKSLRAEAERRRLRRQTVLLALAALLIELCLMLSALVLYPDNPALAILCGIYFVISLSGGGVLAIVFIRKRRELILCQSL